MSPRSTVLVLVLVLVLSVATSTAYSDDKLGALVMDGHDEGHIVYADRCSNGANGDDAGRDRFIAALRADRKSRLARTLAEAEARFVTDKMLYEVELGDWIQTYHLRDGCADSSNSYSALVFVRSKLSNIHELRTKYVITLDDDVTSERRRLRVRSVVPLALRDR